MMRARQVAFGLTHTLALSETSDVFACGSWISGAVRPVRRRLVQTCAWDVGRLGIATASRDLTTFAAIDKNGDDGLEDVAPVLQIACGTASALGP
jgi:hypothetical protein